MNLYILDCILIFNIFYGENIIFYFAHNILQAIRPEAIKVWFIVSISYYDIIMNLMFKYIQVILRFEYVLTQKELRRQFYLSILFPFDTRARSSGFWITSRIISIGPELFRSLTNYSDRSRRLLLCRWKGNATIKIKAANYKKKLNWIKTKLNIN